MLQLQEEGKEKAKEGEEEKKEEEEQEKEKDLGQGSPLGQSGPCSNQSCDSPRPADQPFFFPHTRSRPSLPPAMPTLPEEEEDSPEELDSSSSSPSTVRAHSLLPASPLPVPTLTLSAGESDESSGLTRALELLINPTRLRFRVGDLGTQASHINPEIRLQMRLRNPIPRTRANTFRALTFIEGLHAALAALGILLLVFLCKDEL